MNKFPKVLLIGNGINRAFGGDSWTGILKRISKRNDIPIDDLKSPMPLQAVLVTNNDIKAALDSHKNLFYGSINNTGQESAYKSILSLGFDHILTTNYSYELEIASLDKDTISDYELLKMVSHTTAVERAEPKYLLHTYNQCKYKNIYNKIWHIHGEARKPDGMVLGHYYYSNLLCRMKNYLDKKGTTYKKKQDAGKDISFDSWLDALVLGNVYIIGFGYDLSEFELWWLLNRKYREKADKGKVYFFVPESNEFDEKTELLKIMGVEIINCGVSLPPSLPKDCSDEEKELHKNETKDIFKVFYPKALEKILELMN